MTAAETISSVEIRQSEKAALKQRAAKNSINEQMRGVSILRVEAVSEHGVSVPDQSVHLTPFHN